MKIYDRYGRLLVVTPEAVEGPASAVDGNLAVFDGTTGKKIKDGGDRVKATYVVAHDDSTRSTTSTAWVTEPNLSVSIAVKNNDIVVVDLQGWFCNSNAANFVQANIVLDSGSALSSEETKTIMDRGKASVQYTDHFTNQMFKATADGTLVFKMSWCVNDTTGYCGVRRMKALVVGKYVA